MLTDERYRQLMKDVGLPNSISLLQALKQCAMEAALIERAAPVPAMPMQDSQITDAQVEEVHRLVVVARKWGLNHTGQEPSVSIFHKSMDELLVHVDNLLEPLIERSKAMPIPKQEDASGDKWFVFDPEGNMETLYDSREAAEKAKNDLFDWYQEYAADQGWHEDTGRVLWGRVYQELEVYNSGEKMLFEGEMVDCYRGRWVNREPVPAQAAAIPNGFKIVPDVGNNEMLFDGTQALRRGIELFGDNYTQIVSNIWEDMCEAAPKPNEKARD